MKKCKHKNMPQMLSCIVKMNVATCYQRLLRFVGLEITNSSLALEPENDTLHWGKLKYAFLRPRSCIGISKLDFEIKSNDVI